MCLDTVCADFVAPCHFFIDSDNRLLSNILFVVRAIDGARGPGDLGFAPTETKCRRSNFEPRMGLVQKKRHPFGYPFSLLER